MMRKFRVSLAGSGQSPSEVLTYQSKVQMVAGGVATMIFFFIGLSGVIAGSSIMEKIGSGVFGFLASLCMYRYAQSNMTAEETGISVNNPWSRFQLDWEDIARFEIGRWKLSSAICLIHEVGGRVRPAVGIVESSNFPNGSAKCMVDELNKELANRIPDRREGGSGMPAGAAQRELFRTAEG
jgi:hypothetical protein